VSNFDSWYENSDINYHELELCDLETAWDAATSKRIKELENALLDAADDIDKLNYNFNAGKLHEAGDKYRAIANGEGK